MLYRSQIFQKIEKFQTFWHVSQIMYWQLIDYRIKLHSQWWTIFIIPTAQNISYKTNFTVTSMEGVYISFIFRFYEFRKFPIRAQFSKFCDLHLCFLNISWTHYQFHSQMIFITKGLNCRIKYPPIVCLTAILFNVDSFLYVNIFMFRFITISFYFVFSVPLSHSS